MLPTLSLLKDTYRLGLVTNGNTYPERCGLPGLFAFTIFAQDYQVQKPQPEFYERVLSETHTPTGDHSCWRFLTYNSQSKNSRWGAALPGNESSIPMIDADFPSQNLPTCDSHYHIAHMRVVDLHKHIASLFTGRHVCGRCGATYTA